MNNLNTKKTFFLFIIFILISLLCIDCIRIESKKRRKKIKLINFELSSKFVSIEVERAILYFDQEELIKVSNKMLLNTPEIVIYGRKGLIHLIDTLNNVSGNVNLTLKQRTSTIAYSAVIEVGLVLLEQGDSKVFNKKTKEYEKLIWFHCRPGLFNERIKTFHFEDGTLFFQYDLSL